MKSHPQTKPLTMSVDEASKRLGIGRGQTYVAVRRGEIPSIKIGKRRLIPIAAFEKLLEGQPAKG